MGKWAGQVVGKINTGAGIDRRSFPLEGSIVLACLALPCLPACQAARLVLSCGYQLEQERATSSTFPQVAPFEPLSPEFCCDGLLWQAGPSFLFFSFPVESSSLRVPGWAGDGVRKFWARVPGDIEMEGRSLIDGLAGWGPNSAEVLSGHPAAHPRNKSSLDQPVVASWPGWPSVQVQVRYIRRPGLAFPTRAAAERRHFDWPLVACAPVLPGMALKRERAIAVLAVRQPWQRFLGRGGPTRP